MNEIDDLHAKNAALEKELAAKNRALEIEAALEKVRARTMAMQHSNELAEAAVLLFKNISELGLQLWVCGFCICKQDSEIVEKWMSPPDGNLMDPVYVPYTIDPFEKHAYETWKSGGKIYHDHQEGKELQKSHEETLLHPSMQKARNHLRDKNISLPTSVYRFAAAYNNGYLMIVTTQPFEETEIIIRFAKVFEQTYTRFLDLQKAEAQARESQIQLALERVRARAMAMQKSIELQELIATVAAELTKLDFTLNRSFIVIFDPQTFGSTWWMSHPESPEPIGLFVKYNDYPPYLEQLKGWREQNIKWQYLLGGKEKKTWDKFLFYETDLSLLPEAVKTNMQGVEEVYISGSYNNFGS